MKALVETIAKALVDNPSQVVAAEETEEDTLVIKLTVAKEDMGRIIGKEGRKSRIHRFDKVGIIQHIRRIGVRHKPA